MNAAQFPSRHIKVARLAGAHGDKHRIKGSAEIPRRQVLADVNARFELNAFAESCARRRSITLLSSLKSGMPNRRMPPMRSSFSNTVTRWPRRRSCCAAEIPAGPLPMTATVLPSRARRPRHHPALLPCVFDDGELDLLDGHRAALIESVQAVSHGAGQILP